MRSQMNDKRSLRYSIMLILYTIFMFSLIPIARSIQNTMENILGSYTNILFAIIFVCIFASLLLKIFYDKRYDRLVPVFMAIILCLICLRQIQFPIEQIHFLFYAVWAHLALRASLARISHQTSAAMMQVLRWPHYAPSGFLDVPPRGRRRIPRPHALPSKHWHHFVTNADEKPGLGFKKMQRYFMVLVLGCLTGCADEWLQALCPNRFYDVMDILYNCVGILIGMLSYSTVWE